MKIGVFGGGFKPFTTGHFSKLSLSLLENDITYLFYGVSPRKKDCEFIYTEKMAEKIFKIVSLSIKERFGDKVIVKKGMPNPIVEVFNLIESVKRKEIDAERVTVYSGEADNYRFTKYIGTPYEKKYFGNLFQDKRLFFKTGDIDSLTSSMRTFYPTLSEKRIAELVNVRGTSVRRAVFNKDIQTVKSYIPVFLFQTRYNGNTSSEEIIKTLCGG
jgi:hypothetical protein